MKKCLVVLMLLLAVAFAVTFIIVRNSRRWVHYQAPAIR